MPTLTKGLRTKLENTITKAREVAEEAAKSALEQLGVEQSRPYAYLSVEQRELRRRLRAHGRQLGDILNPDDTQEIVRLIEEVAYEHWHRMLFARFLAENQLLMFFEGDDIENAVAVSLEECEEIAPEMGCPNGWELASKLAAKMLPQIFRPESPVFELRFAPEKQKALEVLLSDLESEVFTASDSLGWVYQFWQSKKKDEVNKLEVKIGARELPVVTQLFTEPYMVNFLLDNSLGAWWARKRLSEVDFQNAVSQEELRDKARIQGVPLEYLRFVKSEKGSWSPAGGTFEGWPERLSELKALDPCCGSGHFLVAAFQMLVPMRMELEGLSAREACDAVLSQNIHGLEIDQRCVELAAFAVALTAWNYPGAGGFRQLPELQIAWCGQSVNVKKEEWLSLADDDSVLRMHLEELYNLFKDAPVLGSLLNPRKSLETGGIFEKDWENVSKLLQAKLESKKNENDGLGIVAQGMEKAFQLLGDKYHLVATNVPYLGKGKMSDSLRRYVGRYFDEADDDLATAMMMRCKDFCELRGVQLFITSKNWMFIKTFEAFRTNLLNSVTWKMVIDLGFKAFSTQMYDFPVSMTSFINSKNTTNNSINSFSTGDCSIENKIFLIKESTFKSSFQKDQLTNPQHRIIFGIDFNKKLIRHFAKSTEGLSTGDSDKYIQFFWENTNIYNEWEYYQTSPSKESCIDGCSKVIFWQNGKGELSHSKAARIQGNFAWGKKGIIIGRVGQIRSNLYLGYLFDKSSVVLTLKDSKWLDSLYHFVRTDSFKDSVRAIDKKLGVATSVFETVPLNINEWLEHSGGDIPKPYSNDPTQWIFHGYPTDSEAPLQVTVARLLGYCWPAETDKDMELTDEAKGLIKRCEELLPYADEDGIVCIPPVRGEASASERLLNLLAEAYKGEDITAVLSSLLASADHAGKSLDSWLRDKFFTQHCKLFGHRPFIWHIWDGLKDGFAALVNYHKLDRKNLETLTYTYLGDWINKQKTEAAARVDGAEERLAAAESLKKSLELILEGEAPYDIFVRWKPIEALPIGWNPDINDGVRLNIRPFMTVPDVGKKGAGILRDKPNINWGKDRGKDPASSPWYDQFKVERINDYHLKLDEKKKAQEKRETE